MADSARKKILSRQWTSRLVAKLRSVGTSLRESTRGLPVGHPVGCRADRLNRVAAEIENARDYLEIGVQSGLTLSSVNLANKTGVDPYFRFNHNLARGVTLHEVTSDEFFLGLSDQVMYDLIFLDGLHTFEQTAKDFVNALKHLKPGGVIVIDDVVPSSMEKALPDREESIRLQILKNGKAGGAWFGDVWKLPIAISELYPGVLHVETYGFGVCGQSVVRYPTQSARLGEISEGDFVRFDNLAYADYFPSGGEVLLPGYSREETRR